jgi:hypothetical protein
VVFREATLGKLGRDVSRVIDKVPVSAGFAVCKVKVVPTKERKATLGETV